jgi:hypothetical protein
MTTNDLGYDSFTAKPGVAWSHEPEAHDFPAAASYLDLLIDDVDALKAVLQRLRGGRVVYRKAKDILRASQLALLPTNNPHVAADLDKIKQGKKLSPILLVRGDLATGVPLQIADGYHRVCASYHTDENTDIPVVIVGAK